jgi:hypothetical protein
MLQIITNKSHLLSDLDSYDNYTELQNHLLMYKIFSENPNEMYKRYRFPESITSHVRSERAYLIDLIAREHK